MSIKSFILYTLAGLLCITLCSCKKYLDTTPTGILTDANFWKSQDDALAGVNACYATLRDANLFGTEGMQEFELGSPNGIYSGSSDGDQIINIAQSSQNSTNTGIINGRWNADFQGVGRTNSVIFYVPAIAMDAALRSRITGEAYFLRALYYQDLVNYYGTAPLILAPPNINQSSIPRSTKDSILNQVYADLDSATAKLPLSYSGADIGRVTKGAALALKTRVLLYQGKWTAAASAAQSVRALGMYSLFADYRGLFMPTNKNNKEVIFDVQFNLPNYGNSFDVNTVKYNNTAPSKDLVDAYLCSDGLPTSSSPLYSAASPYNNRDPRLRKTVVLPGFYFRNVLVSTTTFATKTVWKKITAYQDSVAAPSPDYTDLTSSNNFIMLRYAETLLNYAEATNEATGPDATVYAAIDSVRLRAGMPKASVVNPGLDQAGMRNLIRLERRIELAGEGWYYDDIRRWKIAEVVNLLPAYDISGALRFQRNFQANRDYLWPVPGVQRQNNPVLTQNPNYLN